MCPRGTNLGTWATLVNKIGEDSCPHWAHTLSGCRRRGKGNRQWISKFNSKALKGEVCDRWGQRELKHWRQGRGQSAIGDSIKKGGHRKVRLRESESGNQGDPWERTYFQAERTSNKDPWGMACSRDYKAASVEGAGAWRGGLRKRKGQTGNKG